MVNMHTTSIDILMQSRIDAFILSRNETHDNTTDNRHLLLIANKTWQI